MKWMRVAMSSRDVASGRHIRLQDAFERAFLAAVAPKGAVMFENDPTHDEYVFYFSPGTVAIFGMILATYGAIECHAPPRAGTSLLIGHAEAWDMLAPDAGALEGGRN